MSAWLRLLLEVAAAVVSPDRCAACDEPVPMMTAFCRACAATLVPARPRDPRHLAAFVYGGAAATAIGRFKFDRRVDLARPLAASLCRAARALTGDLPDVVVPVPLHPERLVLRGYNQSALLAGPLARHLRVAWLPRGLARRRSTGRQATLDREARATNVRGAFCAVDAGALRGRRVLLVDDVRTSGATLAACAAAVLEAGARDARSLVFAQAEFAQAEFAQTGEDASGAAGPG